MRVHPLPLSALVAAAMLAAPPVAARKSPPKKAPATRARPAPAARAPAGAFAALRFFKGGWKCRLTRAGAGAVRALVDVRPGLGGFFLVARYRERPRKGGPAPLTAVQHLTFDRAAGGFVAAIADGLGGLARATTRGLEGDRLVLTGERRQGGASRPFRVTITRTDGRHFTLAVEEKAGGGWRSLAGGTCKLRGA